MSENKQYPSYKVVVLGESSAGKTSLVHRFTSNRFDTRTSNTIGAAFTTKVYSTPDKPDRKINLEIWDTAGQERYRSLTPMYYRNAKTALVCFDMSNVESTLETAEFWIQQLELNNSSSAENGVEVRLVGTKADLFKGNKADLDAAVRGCMAKHNVIASYDETSSKLNDGIAQLFTKIVDSISDEYIRQYSENQGDDNGMRNLLSSREMSSCC